jgi:hypothetical protein
MSSGSKVFRASAIGQLLMSKFAKQFAFKERVVQALY